MIEVYQVQQTDLPTTQALYRALKVLITTAHVREYLQANDPKALEQAEYACSTVEPKAQTKNTRRPRVDQWISYMDPRARVTSKVVDMTDTTVILETGVEIPILELEPEGSNYWQTKESRREYHKSLRRGQS